MALSMSKIIQKARSELNSLTGLEISSTISAQREEDRWLVSLEAVEKRSIPDSMDILATYEMGIDLEGNMQEFRRTKMRKRIDTKDTEE